MMEKPAIAKLVNGRGWCCYWMDKWGHPMWLAYGDTPVQAYLAAKPPSAFQ